MTRSTRIADAFAKCRGRGEAALAAYLMAGDPDPARALAYARAALAHADVLEIGVPFSDPVADGPVIERAGVRARAGGANAGDAFGLAAALRRETGKPIVLMTYYNPIFRVGLETSVKVARSQGVDGLIVPDLPLEESAPLRAACDAQGLDLVLLASPASPSERIARIAEATRGFLYLVSSYGVTGARGGVADATRQLVARAKAAAGDVPVAVGFGVAAPEHAAALRAAGADGVIVGSALVRLVEEGRSPEDLGAFLAELKAATRG